MQRVGKWMKITGIMLSLVLAVGLLLPGQNVEAATKKQALNVTHISMSVNQTRTLSVSNASKVTWSSSNKKVATISKNGKLTAKSKGKATITATAGKKTFKCYVVVNKPTKKNKDILITYFSHTGTTKAVAQNIQKLTGGDLLRIREKTTYTSDYDKLVEKAKEELDGKKSRKSTTEARNIKSYDVIYVGYPIWWGSTPRVVNTFLEKYNLEGKIIIPFATSGGSGIEDSIPDLKESCPGATFKDGYLAEEGSLEEIWEWLVEIGELEAPDGEEGDQGGQDTSAPAEDGKLLVAYFSWSGTSERIAKNIIEQTGADSFRIERATPYSDDYSTVAYGEAKEEADNNARPPLKDPLASVAEYDKIVICYPIWWHTAPMTVGTFLESYDLTGKTIYPISQSASMDTSQYRESVEFIRGCAKGATVDDGLFSKNNTAIAEYVEGTVLK